MRWELQPGLGDSEQCSQLDGNPGCQWPGQGGTMGYDGELTPCSAGDGKDKEAFRM